MREFRPGCNAGGGEATMITRYYTDYLFVGDSGSGLLASGVVDGTGPNDPAIGDDDQTRLSEHSVGVAHCPASNGRHASGIAPVVDLRQRGIPVGLGTDGPASHSRLDMFAEMRLAIRMARLRALDAEALTPRDALAMATSEAATALARSDIGTLQPGRWADMVNVAVEGSSFTPVLEPEDLLTHLVWSGSPSDIRSVWVGGHQVVDNGRCLTVDVAEAQREVTVRARGLVGNR